MDIYNWNWVQFVLSLPVVFMQLDVFSFEPGNLISWNLNMFTLDWYRRRSCFLVYGFLVFFQMFFPPSLKPKLKQFICILGTQH
jgi:Cu2+-exporting ATPase